MRTPFPWAFSSLKQPAYGLREACARVAYVPPFVAAEMASYRGVLGMVARWRTQEPAKWAELLTAMQIDLDARS